MKSGLRLISLLLLFIAIVVILRSGRHNVFHNASQGVEQVTLLLPPRAYVDVAWINEQEIAFLYEDSFNPLLSNQTQQLAIYNIGSRAERVLALLSQEDCDRTGYSLLSLLPDKSLGYIRECHKGMTSIDAQLIRLSPTTGERNVLYNYPADFFPSTYSFAPSMNRSLHSQHGGMKNNYIYMVHGKEDPQLQFEQFAHTTEPSWSPSGAQIAFFVIQGDPDTAGQDSQLGGAETLRAGWDLMIARSDGQEVHVVAQGVQFPDSLVWSPNEHQLAFSGRYNGNPGIWLLDLTEYELSQLWHSTAKFALSPDAQKIVLIQENRTGNGAGIDTNELVMFTFTHMQR